MSIKILNIINSLDAGGAESRLKNLVLEEKKYPEFITEICVLYSLGIFGEEIQKNNIPLYNLNLKSKYDLSGIFKIIKLVKKEKPDIVHVRLFPAILFVAIASLLLSKNIQFIEEETSPYNHRRSSKIFKLLDKFIYSRYTKIICVSQQTQDSLLAWLPQLNKKSIVIPNAIPIPNFIPTNYPQKIDALFVGRLEKVKNANILLEAINLLKFKYQKQIKVAIAGDGPLRKDLEEMVKKLKIDENIEFLGIRKDIDKLMFSSKMLVLPSKWEGLPITILEAMSRKLPVIATSVGGIPEVIENYKEGILIPPENPKELAKAINKLLDNKNLREELAENAYKKIKENYSIEQYAEKILDLYKQLIYG